MSSEISVAIGVDNLRAAEAEFSGVVDIIGPYLESKNSGNAELFLDQLVNLLPEQGDLEDIYFDKKLQKIINYDILCNVCESAIKLIVTSLDNGYKAGNMDNLLVGKVISRVKRLDAFSIIVTLDTVSLQTVYGDTGRVNEIKRQLESLHRDSRTSEHSGTRSGAYVRNAMVHIDASKLDGFDHGSIHGVAMQEVYNYELNEFSNNPPLNLDRVLNPVI